MLIPDYLATRQSPAEFFAALEPQAHAYSGFNLLLADRDSLWYGCNRATPFARALPPGVYGLSNEFLDTPWPKLTRVRRTFEAWLTAKAAKAAALFALLDDRQRTAIDEELPDTGLSREWERILSSPFVHNPDYGTRCSTLVRLADGGQLQIAERRFNSQGEETGETEFALNAGVWP